MEGVYVVNGGPITSLYLTYDNHCESWKDSRYIDTDNLSTNIYLKDDAILAANSRIAFLYYAERGVAP